MEAEPRAKADPDDVVFQAVKSGLTEPEPQPQHEPVAMVEELQAEVAEVFDGLTKRIELIRKQQDSRLQSLLDMLRADGSPQGSGRERPNTTKLPASGGPGLRSTDEASQTMDIETGGGSQDQNQIQNRAPAEEALDPAKIAGWGSFTERTASTKAANCALGHTHGLMHANFRSQRSAEEALHPAKIAGWGSFTERTASTKAASFALGHTHGLMHAHFPSQRSAGLLGSAQLGYVRWVEFWADEPEREGCLARFVDGSLTYVCAVLILLNAIVMALMANKEMASPKDELSPVFEFFEYCFVVSYLLEQILKLSVHGMYHVLGPGAKWNCFDIVVLISSILALAPEVEGVALIPLRSLRVLKITKFLRLLRVFRIFTPLRHMLTALMASAVPLFWSLVMLAFLMFMFALFFLEVCSQRLKDPDVLPGSPLWMELQTHFNSLGTATYTLFAALTGGEWTEQYETMREVSSLACMGYLFYIAFFNVAVLNIVTGMFVNSAMKLGQPDLDEQAQDKLIDHKRDLEEFRVIADEIDADGSGFVTLDELRDFMCNPAARARLAVLGVEPKDATTFVDLLFAASGGAPISVTDFVNGCCRLAGHASMIDLQCNAFQMFQLLQQLRAVMSMMRRGGEAAESQTTANQLVIAQRDCSPRPSQKDKDVIYGRGQGHPSPGAGEHQAQQFGQDALLATAGVWRVFTSRPSQKDNEVIGGSGQGHPSPGVEEQPKWSL